MYSKEDLIALKNNPTFKEVLEGLKKDYTAKAVSQTLTDEQRSKGLHALWALESISVRIASLIAQKDTE